MRTFSDNAGRTWTVAVNVDAIRRVRTMLPDTNLVGADYVRVIEKLSGDPVLLCDVLWCIVQPEAVTRSVTDEDFGRAMAGDAIEHASRALFEELADFTPNPRDRARAQRVVKSLFAMAERAHDAADEAVTAGLAKAEASLLGITGRSSGDSPESSASTPAR